MQLKSAYERLVNVTGDEWQAVEKQGVVEPVKKAISKFWEDIEFITTAFFDVLELLNRKDYLEKSILTIWKSQLVQVKDKESPQEEVVPSSEEGMAVVPGYLEYLNSQLVELRGRIKWVEYNLMKYRFAASHGPELKSIIDQVLKGSKRHGKWPRLPRSWRHQHRKLEQEVEWYRKRLKFFREDVQRIKSVHQAIFQKYLTPEDQKCFPSTTYTLEYRLKGNPTNYPGSWIEASRHSGLSTNLSGHSSTSGNTVLPWTISMAGPSRHDSPSAIHASQVENREQRQETKVEAERMNEKLKDQNVSKIPDCNSETSNTEGKFVIEANCSLNREIPNSKLNSKMVRSHERYSEHERFGSPVGLASSMSQCYGDGGRKSNSKIPLPNSNDLDHEAQFMAETSKMEVVNKVMDDRNPFLKDEASKTERTVSTTNSNSSTNPFGEDDVDESSDVVGNGEVDCCDGGATDKTAVMSSPERCNTKSSTRQPSSDSSYESAEEVLTGSAAGSPSKIMDQQSSQQKSPQRMTQCSSLTHLASSVYVPCSIPLFENSGPAMRHISSFPSSNVPQLVSNYELLFSPETDKPQRNVLKKLFGKKK